MMMLAAGSVSKRGLGMGRHDLAQLGVFVCLHLSGYLLVEFSTTFLDYRVFALQEKRWLYVCRL